MREKAQIPVRKKDQIPVRDESECPVRKKPKFQKEYYPDVNAISYKKTQKRE